MLANNTIFAFVVNSKTPIHLKKLAFSVDYD